MDLTLIRDTRNSSGTFGMLALGGHTWQTAEEDWRNNQRGKSCIPAGIYALKRGMFAKHGDCFEVTGVPGRSAILIHPGNTEEDTEGCILLGTERGFLNVRDEDAPEMPMARKMAVLHSKIAFAQFMAAMSGVQTATLAVVWSPKLEVAV